MAITTSGGNDVTVADERQAKAEKYLLAIGAKAIVAGVLPGSSRTRREKGRNELLRRKEMYQRRLDEEGTSIMRKNWRGGLILGCEGLTTKINGGEASVIIRFNNLCFLLQ